MTELQHPGFPGAFARKETRLIHPETAPGPPLFLCPSKRAVRAPDALAASLVPGAGRVENRQGNGDCLLLDFSRLLFAVCDGSDRFPAASRAFLARLAGLVSAAPLPATRAAWLALVNQAYAGQEYIEKTTFSGVALTPTRDRAFILHGGDSMVFIFSPFSGALIHSTFADMNFAGRAPALTRVEAAPLPPGSLIAIATDGLSDVARLAGMSAPDLCAAALSRFPIHQLPDKLPRFLANTAGDVLHDDIGLILLDPRRVPAEGPTLLLGGTTSIQERRVQALVAGAGADACAWAPLSRALSTDWTEWGIRVLEA